MSWPAAGSSASPSRPNSTSTTTTLTTTTSGDDSRADVFELLTSAPSRPAYDVDDPRVALRPVVPSSSSQKARPHDATLMMTEPTTLSAFREREGSTQRQTRLQRLFESIKPPSMITQAAPPPTPVEAAEDDADEVAAEEEERKRREENRKIYARELWGKCTIGCEQATAAGQGGEKGKLTRWKSFERYAEEKERELWTVFRDFDVDGDMKLRTADMREACHRAGYDVKESTLQDFMRDLDKNKDGYITFGEWRDFLLLLPRPTNVSEIFKFYQSQRSFRPSMSHLTPDADVVVGRGKTGWDKRSGGKDKSQSQSQSQDEQQQQERIADAKGKGKASEEDDDDEEDEGPTHGMFAGAGKFLLAGGVAGAVSRSATAPFDRLKVYLITSPYEKVKETSLEAPSGLDRTHTHKPRKQTGSIREAARAVMRQGGGIKAFWTGNGLNVIKIFPESAIKFLSYESAKRIFAKYWDEVPDQTMISNSSRFVAGGIGGVSSQFFIYPIETLKTRVMSSTGGKARGNELIVQTARDMWRAGGIRLYFRGLTAGLIGVFPYSAIDMSTFEGIKLAYKKWSGSDPGVFGSLAFGAISGAIGATSVYPLNLVRTRLQAQGTLAHPQRYTGIRDAALKCYRREGVRGFYKGLSPTLLKVVPAVAISYAVYDTSKRVLFGSEDPELSHDVGEGDTED